MKILKSKNPHEQQFVVMSYILKFQVSTIEHREEVKRAEIIIGEMIRQYKLEIYKIFC